MINTVEQLKKWIDTHVWTREQVASWATSQFWRRAIFRQTSDGAVHAGLPVALDAAGKLDSTFYDSADVVLTTGAQNVGGVKTFTSDLHVGDGTGNVVLRLLAAAGAFVADISWRRGGVNRWIMRMTSTTESGGNVGSNWTLNSRDDAGASLGFPITAERTGNVGFNIVTPLGQVHIDQNSTTGAKPVLVLDQADLSEEFIEFDTTVGAGNPVDTAALGAYYGKVRVSVNGTFKYIALYDS